MCTSFRLKAQGSSVVVGRTMEFPSLMGAKITVLPRGFAGAGIAVSGTGRTWTSDYGVVGMDAFGQPGWLTDGLNEKGAYAGLLSSSGVTARWPSSTTRSASRRTPRTWTGTCSTCATT